MMHKDVNDIDLVTAKMGAHNHSAELETHKSKFTPVKHLVEH